MATGAPRGGGGTNHQDAQKKDNSLRDFQGVNTQATRQNIGDNQFAWLENVMPVGFGNMIVPPGPSGVLATWAGTAYRMKAVDLNGVDYKIILTTNGAIYAVNLSTYAVTTVAAAATLSGALSDVCQWENQQAIIVDANGYFTWDGASLTKWNGTVQSLTITAIGTGYTSSPAAGFSGGGGGAGAAATCHIQVGAFSAIVSAGTGYIPGDVLTFVGGTFTTAGQIKVATVVAATGAIVGANLVSTGNYTVAPANPVAVTGGYGTGATFTLNFGIGPITLTNIGSGYTSAPAVAITGGGGGAGGAVSAVLNAVPPAGTAVATYYGRVWVSNNRTVVFSAPDNFSDFSQAGAGGSFIMTDDTLHSTIKELFSANNFLYIIGESSVNVVGDVSVVSGVTKFSNTNISSSVGSNQPYSVIAYYRAVWFANPYGFFGLYGSTTQKASDDLDGIFPLITSDIPVSAGTSVVNDILTLNFLFRYTDPVLGSRSLIAMFFNKKWFFVSQVDGLKLIDTSVIGGIQVLFGTTGSSLYKLFANSANILPQTIVTKLWDMGNPLRDKATLKFGLEVVNPAAPQKITGTIDTEYTSGAYAFSLSNNNYVQWINNSSSVVTWVNNSGTTVNWIASGYSFQAIDVETTGKYIGVTLNGSAAGTIYSAIHLQYELRASW